MWGENADFWLVSTFNTGGLPLRGILPVMSWHLTSSYLSVGDGCDDDDDDDDDDDNDDVMRCIMLQFTEINLCVPRIQLPNCNNHPVVR